MELITRFRLQLLLHLCKLLLGRHLGFCGAGGLAILVVSMVETIENGAQRASRDNRALAPYVALARTQQLLGLKRYSRMNVT